MWGGQNVADMSYDTDLYILTGVPADSKVVNEARPWMTYWILHGMFMVLGWGICLQAGAFVARYFRRKDPFWFKFHRAVQPIGLLLAIAVSLH